jgi:hypothetical protein
MRDKRFITEHRGGPLTKEQHRQLMQWSIKCSQHVLPLYGEKPDKRLLNALRVSKAWMQGEVSVGDARRAAYDIIALAKELTDPVTLAVARAVGQTVATAHMADHALGGAWYGLRAVKAAGKSVEKERKWQEKQLPPEIKDLVISAFTSEKFKTKQA